MIALIVSVISFLVIVFVTVYLINKSIDEANERKADVRKVVDQVNTVNSSAADIEKKQNMTISDLNITLTGMKTNITAMNDNLDKLRSDATLKDDLQKTLATNTAKVNTLNVNNATITQDNSSMLNISMAGSNSSNVSRIVGFDHSTMGRRMTLGSELSILESGASNLYTPFDSRGDVFIMTQSNDKRLFMQSGKNTGIVVKGDKVGVGMDPKYSQLDVKGGLAVISDNNLLMGGSNASKVLSVGKHGELIINEGQGFKGTIVHGTLGIEGDLFLPNGDLRTADGRPLSLGDNLNIDGALKLWGSNILAVDENHVMINNYDNEIKKQVVIGGRSIVVGNATFNTSNNGTNVFYNNAMRFASKESIPQNWNMMITPEFVQTSNLVSNNIDANNTTSFRGIFPNSDKTKHWSMYNNINNDLVFDPSLQRHPASTGTGVGVARVTPDGNFNVTGSGTFNKSVNANGDITSLQNVAALKLCIKNSPKDICLTKEHVEWVLGKYLAEIGGPAPK